MGLDTCSTRTSCSAWASSSLQPWAAEDRVSSIPIRGIEPAPAQVAVTVRRTGRLIAARGAANNLPMRRMRLIISA